MNAKINFHKGEGGVEHFLYFKVYAFLHKSNITRYQIAVLERFNYEQCLALEFNHQSVFFFPKNDNRLLKLVFEKPVSSLISCNRLLVSEKF